MVSNVILNKKKKNRKRNQQPLLTTRQICLLKALVHQETVDVTTKGAKTPITRTKYLKKEEICDFHGCAFFDLEI